MKDPQRIWQNTVNNAQGHLFEEQIVKGCRYYSSIGAAEIDKTPEPFRVHSKSKNGMFTGRFTANAQPDFKGTLKGGQAIVFEAKYTTTEKLHQDVLTNQQYDTLERYDALGAIAGVCAGIKAKCYFIPWDIFRDMKLIFGRKYVTQNDLKKYEVKFNGCILFLSNMKIKK